MYYSFFTSPIGEYLLCGDRNGLTIMTIYDKMIDLTNREFNELFFTDIVKQLNEYFQKKRQSFDILLNPEGSEFQKKVWATLLTIPYGKLCSYKDISIKINNPKSSRAVGNANGKNPLAIIIPCHRVIMHNNHLGGYTGGLKIKKYLLELEDSLKTIEKKM